MKAAVVCLLGLLMAPSIYAKEGSICDPYMDKFEQGIHIAVNVVGRSLFDPDVTKGKSVEYVIKPQVRRDTCGRLGSSDSGIHYFELGKELILEFADIRYAGVFNPAEAGTPRVIIHDTGNDIFVGLANATVSVFHAVVADVARRKEFDSYEAPSASPYIQVADLHTESLPAAKTSSIVFGIAGKYGHLFQFVADSYVVSLVADRK